MSAPGDQTITITVWWLPTLLAVCFWTVVAAVVEPGGWQRLAIFMAGVCIGSLRGSMRLRKITNLLAVYSRASIGVASMLRRVAKNPEHVEKLVQVFDTMARKNLDAIGEDVKGSEGGKEDGK